MGIQNHSFCGEPFSIHYGMSFACGNFLVYNGFIPLKLLENKDTSYLGHVIDFRAYTI